MNKLPVKIRGIVFFVSLMAVTVITWAIRYKAVRVVVKPNKATIKCEEAPRKPYVYNVAVLQKFEAVCQKFNMQKPVFTCSGTINVTNGADSSKTIKNLAFFMCKNGSNCFY